MSLYIAWVGEVIIKDEYRKDFGHLFRGEYEQIEAKRILDFLDEYMYAFTCIQHWVHWDYKPEWKGRYQTSYNRETGSFVYGAAYNLHGRSMWSMHEFFHELLPEMTERVISEDGWAEE